METLEQGFRDMMKQCYPQVHEGSARWDIQRSMFYAGITWVMTMLSEAVESNTVDNPVTEIRKQITEYVDSLSKAAQIKKDILKAGGISPEQKTRKE